MNTELPPARRAMVMMRVGITMMLKDRARFVGTVAGVVFAVVLAAQQLGIMFGLLQKNTMFVDSAAADIWIAPPGGGSATGGFKKFDSAAAFRIEDDHRALGGAGYR